MDYLTLLEKSLADENDVELYTTGFCHVLALALHRMRGWQMLAIVDHSEPYWVDGEDPENAIPSVLHLYAVDPHGVAWDVHGGRPLDAIPAEIEQWLHPNDCSREYLTDEAELRLYTGFWSDDGEPIDRPLPSYRDQDVDEALQFIGRALAPLPAFQRPSKPDTPARRVVEAVRSQVDAHLVTLDFDLSADDDVIVLLQLWSEQERGAGHASRALQCLIDAADEHGVTVMLEVSRLQYDLSQYADEEIDRLDALNQKALTDAQLFTWYGRFGFVPDPTNTPDIAAVMRRQPEPKLQPRV